MTRAERIDRNLKRLKILKEQGEIVIRRAAIIQLIRKENESTVEAI